MEYVRLEAHIQHNEAEYAMGSGVYRWWGKFEYLMYIKTEDVTKIWTNTDRKLLAWNIPAFSLN